MILKGSQRGSGQNLAVHLLKMEDNEHVRVHQVRGFTADDLKGAFKEAEAISLGTKCRQYLFSLSISPPEDSRVSIEEFEATVDRIEERLGLIGQPRAIVFHEKESRLHAHAVWLRIDASTMTARPLPFFKNKLMEVSKDLYLQHGWTMPAGMLDRAMRDPTSFTLAEWQQAKRTGNDPRLLKQVVQRCWAQSDNQRAFSNALEERGLFLAHGDRRGFVVVDHDREVHALPRLLNRKTQEVRDRIGDGSGLRSVADVREHVRARMTPAVRRHLQEAKAAFAARAQRFTTAKAEMTRVHRAERSSLAELQENEWNTETLTRASRLPRGLKGIWYRLTGRYQDIKRDNEREASNTAARHRIDREHMINRQRDQRALLQLDIKKLRQSQAVTLIDLRRELGRRFQGNASDHEKSRTGGPNLRR